MDTRLIIDLEIKSQHCLFPYSAHTPLTRQQRADITPNGKPFCAIANEHTIFITVRALRVDPQRTSDHEATIRCLTHSVVPSTPLLPARHTCYTTLLARSLAISLIEYPNSCKICRRALNAGWQREMHVADIPPWYVVKAKVVVASLASFCRCR